jgi:hypothetical protein
MTLEMVPNTPKLFYEANSWEQKAYSYHFRNSTFFLDKEFFIKAYEHAPVQFLPAL